MPISSQLDEPNGPAMSLNANVDEFENSESAFATGIVTEWLTEPSAPLDRWATQNAEFHPDDMSTAMDAQIAVATERVPRAEYVVRVRFSEGPWHGARITLTAATAGSNGHGLMRVESASREGKV